MSRHDIQHLANCDTPATVNVPDSWRGLAIWAIGRFGGGIIIAAVMAYFAHRVYEDHSALTQQVIRAYQDQSGIQARNASALDSLSRAVEALTREAQVGHRELPRR